MDQDNTMTEHEQNILEVCDRNIDIDEKKNIEKALKLINNKSLVKYNITNEELNIVFDLKNLEEEMGIVVGNVPFKDVEWVYDSDIYGTGKKFKDSKEQDNKRSKVNQIFDYFFGVREEDREDEWTEPVPSLSIDKVIDAALSKLTGDFYSKDPAWTLEEEDVAITEHLKSETDKMPPAPDKEKEKEYEGITGWVKVVWPQKDGITTIEHVSFLREVS